MNKAKTLKRRLGNTKPFFSVAWNTEDIPSQITVNPNFKGRDIDWKRALKNVFKLQKLIYKASSRGEIRKMHKYQRLLRKSYYPRLLAVRDATRDNQGQKTAGIDGISNLPLMQGFNLVELINTSHFRASLTRGVWRPKPGKDEKLPLGIRTIYDRALQVLVKLGLEPEWEACFEPNSYGFRPGRSTHDAIQAVYISINQKPKYVLDAGISNGTSK